MAYYQQQMSNPQNMQFYQSNYSYQQPTNAQGTSGMMGSMDSNFGSNIDVSGVMGNGN